MVRSLTAFPLSVALVLSLCGKPTFAINEEAKDLVGKTVIGEVVEVHDGDRFTLKLGDQQYGVYVQGIDAPDIGQSFGAEAKEALSRLILDNTVKVKVARHETGVLVGVVYVGATKVSDYMLAEGWAWRFYRSSFQDVYSRQQQLAKIRKLGLWAGKDPEPPWMWRRRAKDPDEVYEIPDPSESESASEALAKEDVAQIEPEALLKLHPRKSKLIRTRLPVTRFSVTRPSVLSINQYSPTEFEVVGGQDGEATLSIWFGPAPSDPVMRVLVKVSSE
jgi:endonuclease YncB( thermonuclease family)